MKTYEFGKTKDGQNITSYVLENDHGIRAEFLDYGCILRQLWVPLEDGSFVNIVHGLDSVADYEQDTCNFGAFIGRFANRIKDSRFMLNGNLIQLEPNDGPNHLHGVWGKRVFSVSDLPAATLDEASRGLVMTYHSPDGEDGFPGNVEVKVIYYLDQEDTLHMDYEAISDQDTVINLTNHSYFQLGAGQLVQVRSDSYLEIDDQVIPTGKILNVRENPEMDLRKAVDPEKQYPERGFFDHCYLLDHEDGCEDPADVILTAPGRGIGLEIRTSEPAVQIYSGNPVGIAAEPQMYPCAPNYPEFPSCTLQAGKLRKWRNSYRIVHR